MASQQQSPGLSASYKRASRKGAPRKFACEWQGCDKVYSRAEHLQRHQLNHNPKEVYRCDVPDCTQEFVRQDLLARHKKRHSDSYVPRNRTSSFSIPRRDFSRRDNSKSNTHTERAVLAALGDQNTSPLTRPTSQLPLPPAPPLTGQATTTLRQPASMPRNGPVLLSDSPNHVVSPLPSIHTNPITYTVTSSWASPPRPIYPLPPRPPTHAREQPASCDNSNILPFQNPEPSIDSMLANVGDVGINWLFDPVDQPKDLSFTEGGLGSALDSSVLYDRESFATNSQPDLDTPSRLDLPDELLSNQRRQEVLRWVRLSCEKRPKYHAQLKSLLQEVAGDLPHLSIDFMGECIQYYWNYVSPRIPIIHQPTFSPVQCPLFLFLVMFALGAAQKHNQCTNEDFSECKSLADLIIECVRFDILMSDDAEPPVDLWVAQALLHLEFYEKMYSSRKLHERSHIYHSNTLNILRRGSHLIGRSGSTTPPSTDGDPGRRANLTVAAWWKRWADTEAIHRVVFVAFMMDIIHAAMFGHSADMAPHEIRLPLPCDDLVWSASSPEAMRQQREAQIRMHGGTPLSFLEGLKRAIHRRPVRTHPFGRMIIMCGLLSVGWHLRHRETHLKWFLPRDSDSNNAAIRDKWCRMLLQAFDDWFDTDKTEARISGNPPDANGLIQDPAVLYHLAHIGMYVDIVDCQVYAGAKYVIGREVSKRDYKNVASRMSRWPGEPKTRHAILRAISHAFQLLYQIIINPHHRGTTSYQNRAAQEYDVHYSTRNDVDPHRPWIMYYATLSIWSYARATAEIAGPANSLMGRMATLTHRNSSGSISEYLSRVAKLEELDTETAATLHDGLPRLLDAVGALSAESNSELLNEAGDRLHVCKKMMFTGES